MKKSIKIYPVVIAALMALGSVAFVACDKEQDVLTPQVQPEQVSSKSLQFQINECFRDSMGRYWNIKGYGSWVNVNGGRNGVYLNVKFRQRGDDVTYYYQGQAVWNPTTDPVQFTLIPDNEEPSRLVWFVMRDYSKYLLYRP